MRFFFTLLLWSLLAAGWVYWLVAWWWARAFFKRARQKSVDLPDDVPRIGNKSQCNPLTACPAHLPTVSILKPVKGLDPHAWDNFVSFCRQDYPQFEILFGVAEKSDPAVALIRQLQQSFPEVPIRLFVGADNGANPKAALLRRLEANSGGDVLVISDSDIRVEPDYLRRVVGPLRDPKTGLVTCPYRGMFAESLPARFESLYLDVTFLPAVAVADRLGTILGLGATMALSPGGPCRHRRICGAGGPSDGRSPDRRGHSQAGASNSSLGLCGVERTWEDRIPRAMVARSALVAGNSHRLPLRLRGHSADFCHACRNGNVPDRRDRARVALAASLLLRWTIAWQLTGWIGSDEERLSLLWLPLRDCLSFFVWCTGNFGSHVIWRGRRYRIGAKGSLECVPPKQGISRRAIRWLDAFLRKRQQIFDFSDDPSCLLRISADACREERVLADGSELAPGDAVGELHFLNDHLPQIPSDGPGIAWASEARRALVLSLQMLARAAASDPRLQNMPRFPRHHRLRHPGWASAD